MAHLENEEKRQKEVLADLAEVTAEIKEDERQKAVLADLAEAKVEVDAAKQTSGKKQNESSRNLLISS